MFLIKNNIKANIFDTNKANFNINFFQVDTVVD